MFEQIIITGLVTSGVYSMLAIGFSLVIGVARIVNLAHTAAYMLAAYFVYLFSVMLEIPLPGADLSIFNIRSIEKIHFQR